jgi:hypothetical protein
MLKCILFFHNGIIEVFSGISSQFLYTWDISYFYYLNICSLLVRKMIFSTNKIHTLKCILVFDFVRCCLNPQHKLAHLFAQVEDSFTFYIRCYEYITNFV